MTALQHSLVASVLLVVLTGCTGADSGGPSASTPTEAALAETPSFAAVPDSGDDRLLLDEEGDASQPHLDILAVDGRLSGDRILATFQFAGLPEELEPDDIRTLDYFLWRVHVFTAAPGVPLFIVDINPQIPPDGSAMVSSIQYTATAYEVDPVHPQQQPAIFWPADIEVDVEHRQVRVAVRLPNIEPSIQIQLLAYRFDEIPGQPVETEETQTFSPSQGEFALGASLPTPMRPTAERTTDSTSYALSDYGIPVRFVIPSGWTIHAERLATGSVSATPTNPTPEVIEIGVKVFDLGAMPELTTAEAILNRVIEETDGAYARDPTAPPFDLPPGFEVTALLQTTRSFQVEDEPGRLLSNWGSREGSMLRIIIGRAGTQAVIGYFESSEWRSAGAPLSYLSRWEMLP